jgi:diacylglycerol kinase family enzyme/membrane-associated phospholipid phosphatase
VTARPRLILRPGPRGSLPAQVASADAALFHLVADKRTPGLDKVLPRLTTTANHGVLWWAVAAGLGASRGQRRRAAVRGLLALGIASGVANVPAKLSVRRARPPLDRVPLHRRLRSQPITTSFPSGHSASAAAFAVGVAMEAPVAGAAVGVLASAVAYSRIYVGVHYPGDVLAGVALGAGSALLTAKTWPRRPKGPARARPASSQAPALPAGEGLVIVVNSGAGKASRSDVAEAIQQMLPKAEIVQPTEDDDLAGVMADAAKRGQALGVAGGDGTVNAAAAAALANSIPLAVFPAGTLDHFARDAGLDSPQDAADAVEAGTAVAVDVGWIEGDPDQPEGAIFLNTLSLGSYPEIVEMRERLEEYLGKWPAVALAAVRVLRRGVPVELEVDGNVRKLWLLFAGNGGYRPSGFAPTYRPNLDDGLLDVRIVDAKSPLARTRLVLALMSGRLGRSSVYQQRYAHEIELQRTDGSDKLILARDGEIGDQPPKLCIRKHPRRLVVYRPNVD